MKETWRWFGPFDDIRLDEIRQTGAAGIVTALHEIPYGEIWPVETIAARKAEIEKAGLVWSVVESLPIHENVKLGEGDHAPIVSNYIASMRNLAACGVKTICYNFMPVIDWTRTDLDHRMPTGASALRYDAVRFAAFDCFMLARPGAEADHRPENVARGKAWFDAASEHDKAALLASIMAGLPGAYDRYSVEGLRKLLARYAGVDAATLRGRLIGFLEQVAPAAEELGVRLCIHPDDPPRPLMGLPRIVSTRNDIRAILDGVNLTANGLTFCTGSLGAGLSNDVPAMAREFAGRTAFAHLRNVTKEADLSFHEADHLGGDVDMVAVASALLDESLKRKAEGRSDWDIPWRPDHGHALLSDSGRKAHPGYTLVGRLRGLAEMRGVFAALAHAA